MKSTLYVVDAFTNEPFRGNPAAVCVLDEPADEKWMKLVAREMNLAETAFVTPIADGFSLRWLTPKVEVDLCGHATLAAAHVLWQKERCDRESPIRFHTRSGWLTCDARGDWIEMDFPALSTNVVNVPDGMSEALGSPVTEAISTGMDFLVELSSAQRVRDLQVNFQRIAAMPVRGLIVTALSDMPNIDFVSRFFAPACGIDEDPVTGSAHCALAPYWANKLHKSNLVGYQASERGGTVRMHVLGDRVVLSGQAVSMSRIELDW